VTIEDSSDTDVSFQACDKIKKLFKITISFDTFSKICPVTQTYKDKTRRCRDYDVLKPHMWTDVINDLFLKKHKLPCNFTYKRVKVSRDTSRSKKYISFGANCKDCGTELEGWADSKPKSGEFLLINIFANDTIGTETRHTTKRQLKGYIRKRVGEELSTDVGSNWRRKNVADLEFGRISPPNLYNLNVLSKTKQ